MGDDLTAFFSKKANKKDKKKKAGIINIEDVGNRLERKAKRNEVATEELEDEDMDLVKLTKTTVEAMNNRDNEDSEWIDYNVPEFDNLNIAYTEHDYEEENIKTVKETLQKSWTNNKTAHVNGEEKETKVKSPPAPKKFVPRVAREAEAKKTGKKVDLDNEEAFPSLADAGKVEKLIAEREEEEKKQREEQRRREKELEEQQKKIYRPRMQVDGATTQSGRMPYQQRPSQQFQKEAKGEEDIGNWRNKPMETQATSSPKRRVQQEETTQVVSEDAGSWRNVSRANPTPIESSPKKDTSSVAGGEKKSSTYVPPHMRNK